MPKGQSLENFWTVEHAEAPGVAAHWEGREAQCPASDCALDIPFTWLFSYVFCSILYGKQITPKCFSELGEGVLENHQPRDEGRNPLVYIQLLSQLVAQVYLRRGAEGDALDTELSTCGIHL